HLLSTSPLLSTLFFSPLTATTAIYSLSLHDALPIYEPVDRRGPEASCPEAQGPASWQSRADSGPAHCPCCTGLPGGGAGVCPGLDRKSTRLNSSHDQNSYAVFCLKKKKKIKDRTTLS